MPEGLVPCRDIPLNTESKKPLVILDHLKLSTSLNPSWWGWNYPGPCKYTPPSMPPSLHHLLAHDTTSRKSAAPRFFFRASGLLMKCRDEALPSSLLEKNPVWIRPTQNCAYLCLNLLPANPIPLFTLPPTHIYTHFSGKDHLKIRSPLPSLKISNTFNNCVHSNPESVLDIWVHQNRFSYTDLPLNETTAAVTTTTR